MDFLHVKDTVSKLLTLNDQYKMSDNYDEQYHILYDMCRIIEQSPQNVKIFLGDELYIKLLNLKNKTTIKNYTKSEISLTSIYVRDISPLFVKLIHKVNQI